MILIIILVMIRMMINNDDNKLNANDDHTKTKFQTMHFRQPLIREKPNFLALTHVWVYSYSVSLLYYQSVMLL